MIANYHTHTYRCGHAVGHEREYVKQALKAGLGILGFSDHTPQDYYDCASWRSPIRMLPEELPDYAASLRSLAEEYRGRLEILAGVEAEYYPKYFPRLLRMLNENGIRYMILGQHFIGNEIDEPYCGRPTEDASILERYVSQTCEAMDTGLFSCFAHPDLIRFVGAPALYERQIRRLCRKARETDTPLEINLLGIREKRHYPDDRFWRIAAEEGNAVILGCDAHHPRELSSRRTEAKALRLAESFGLTPLQTLRIKELSAPIHDRPEN